MLVDVYPIELYARIPPVQHQQISAIVAPHFKDRLEGSVIRQTVGQEGTMGLALSEKGLQGSGPRFECDTFLAIVRVAVYTLVIL